MLEVIAQTYEPTATPACSMSQDSENCRECYARLRALEDRMMKTETIVGVDDKDTGLRGAVEKIGDRLQSMEKRIYIAMGIGYAAMFVLEKLFK